MQSFSWPILWLPGAGRLPVRSLLVLLGVGSNYLSLMLLKGRVKEETYLSLFLPWGRGLEDTRPTGAARSRKYLPWSPSATRKKAGRHQAYRCHWCYHLVRDREWVSLPVWVGHTTVLPVDQACSCCWMWNKQQVGPHEFC